MLGKNNNYVYVIFITALLLSLVTLCASASKPKESSLRISARAATLYEPETGRFLYSKNSEMQLPMASTTKIMTALVVIENSELSELVTIPAEAVGVEGSSAYLNAGDVLTVEELLYALLLRSANDAAAALAVHVGGSVDEFANKMNEKAKALGLSETNFKNPHGLDHKEHYTTAHDLTLIAAEALKNESFKKICSTYKKSFSHGQNAVLYVNHNKLLSIYDGALGMKTGYTKKSGRCLVGAAERDGLTFITVTLDAPDDWKDHRQLFDLGFNSLEKIEFASKGDYCYSLPVINGSTDTVDVTNEFGANIIVEQGNHTVKEYIKLSKFASAPIKRGEIFGEVIFTVDGITASSIKLVAKDNVNIKKEKNFFEKFIENLGF